MDKSTDTALALPPRDDTAATRTYDRRAVAKAIDALESATGGRDALIAALTAAPPTDDLAYVIGWITDPRNDARKLSTICRAANISVGEVLEALKRGVYAAMTVQVMATVAAKTPGVVEDVFTRAVIHEALCPVCRGDKELSQEIRDKHGVVLVRLPPEPCPTCKATGYIDQLPDLERQKLALDLANLLPKKGPAVVVDQRSALQVNEVTPGSFSRMISAADAVLHRRRAGSSSTPVAAASSPAPSPSPAPVIDGTVVSE